MGPESEKNQNNTQALSPASRPSFFEALKEFYLVPRPWEIRIYEHLGVRFVKSLVVNNPVIKRLGYSQKGTIAENTYFLTSPTYENTQTFAEHTLINEALHEGVLGISTVQVTNAALQGDLFSVGVWSSVFLVNASLISLQRYNRYRALRIMRRKLELQTRNNS